MGLFGRATGSTGVLVLDAKSELVFVVFILVVGFAPRNAKTLWPPRLILACTSGASTGRIIG